MQINIVSDVSCPWCIIAYKSLQLAIANLHELPHVEITWCPFELNPNMASEGQEINEHLSQKYGIDQAQIDQNREHIKQRGRLLGYEFGERGGGRIYNTFDAHRLLHWAKLEQKQMLLKLALFDLYFKEAGNPSDHQELIKKAEKVGLDGKQAEDILVNNTYAEEVRKEQAFYHSMGIASVPAIIVNNKHLISGGQPVDVFEQALRQISTQEAEQEEQPAS